MRCKRPSGYHYTLFRQSHSGMLEETASVTYSVRCFDFKGFKCMTRISFLAIFTAQIFGTVSHFKEKKLQYQLYSEQEANQEDKSLANIANFQQQTQCSRCRIIVQDMITMRTDLNPIVNIF